MNDYRLVFKSYQLHENALIDCLAVSKAVLHPLARLVFPCGVAAASFHDLRIASNDVLKVARWASGTLLFTHASYFAIYSSHSGTPILSAEAVSVFVSVLVSVVVVVDELLAGLLVVVVVLVVVVLVAVELQLENPIVPPTRATIKNRFLFNLIICFVSSEKFKILYVAEKLG